MASEETKTQERSSGRVKWFNNRAGYGFITVIDGEKNGEDIFVHHSSLNVGKEQYKYLVQGEYVEFEWSTTENSEEHKYQASEVSGVNGEKLMCETRNEIRDSKKENNLEFKQKKQTRQSNNYRLRGQGPRSGSNVVDENGIEWMLVRKGKQNKNYMPQQYNN